MEPKREALLTFPCVFPLKVMGRREDGFAQAVAEMVASAAKTARCTATFLAWLPWPSVPSVLPW